MRSSSTIHQLAIINALHEISWRLFPLASEADAKARELYVRCRLEEVHFQAESLCL